MHHNVKNSVCNVHVLCAHHTGGCNTSIHFCNWFRISSTHWIILGAKVLLIAPLKSNFTPQPAQLTSLPVAFQYLRGIRPRGVLCGVLGGQKRPADVSGEEDRGTGACCGPVCYHDNQDLSHFKNEHKRAHVRNSCVFIISSC